MEKKSLEKRMVNKDYVFFEEYYPEVDRKTKVFLVKTISDKEKIGCIEWSCGWRQYCFYSDLQTLWSSGCLKQVYEFIDKLMEDRKK